MRVIEAVSQRTLRIAGAFLVGWLVFGVDRGSAEDADGKTRWYVPREADFRPEYNRDLENQAVQSWGQYWGWINDFYSGNLFSSGWTKQAVASVAAVESATRQREVMVLLNDLGKQISREWAKDNGIRRISTADLERWNGRIQKARRAEDGSGDPLKNVLEAIRVEVSRKLRDAHFSD